MNQENIFHKMINKILQAHPEGMNPKEEREALCDELADTMKNMQGKDLEPYLAHYSVSPEDGCFNITFKIPLIPYIELIQMRLRIPPL